MSTIAGSGVCDFVDGVVSTAQFCNPYGIAVASNGILFVADTATNRIRIVTAAGRVIV